MSHRPIAELIEKPISGEWGAEPTNGHAIGVIRNANFTNEGVMDLSEIVYRDIPERKVAKKALRYGDIIIEKSGGSPTQPVGRVVYYDRPDGELMFSNFTAALRPREGVDGRYLFYMLWAAHQQKRTSRYQNRTTGIANLQLERYIKEVEVPCPPLPEQRRIAAILDKAQALIDNDRRTLALYDQLARSVFLELFGDPVLNERGWEMKPFADLVAEDCPLTYGIVQPGNEVEDGVPIVRPVDLDRRVIGIHGLKRIAKSIADQYSRTTLRGDELLLSVRASIGLMAYATPELEGANVSRGIVPIWPNEAMATREFIFGLFAEPSFQTKLGTIVRGATLKGLNLKDLRRYAVIAPPLREQRTFSSAVERLLEQRTRTQESLHQSEAMFGSLLQGAFDGQ